MNPYELWLRPRAFDVKLNDFVDWDRLVLQCPDDPDGHKILVSLMTLKYFQLPTAQA